MNWFKRNIANMVTCLRIVGAIFLLIFPIDSIPFLILYGFCGLTDILDGFLARLLHTQSELGSVLDSLSDIFFYVIVATKIFPDALTWLTTGNWILIISVAAIHLMAYITCGIKFKKFSSVHTYANKAMSFAIFVFVIILSMTVLLENQLIVELYVYIAGSVAAYSAVEMLLIHIISHRYDERNKSIFLIKRNEKDNLDD